MNKTSRSNFVIKLSFWLVVLACVLMGQASLVLNYICALILHEFGHLIAIKKCGYSVRSFTLSMAGARLDLNDSIMSRDEFEVAVAGPATNIVLALVCIAFWWLVPESYFFTADFAFTNLVLAGFNLLPICSLDGEKIFDSLLMNKYSKNKKQRIKTLISIISSLFFAIFFTISLFFTPNFYFLVFSIFFFISIFKNKNNENVFLKLKPKQNIKPQKMNVIYLPDDATLLQALKFMSPKYVTIFYIDSRLVAEDRIVRLLAQGKSPSTPIVECTV